ncbi:MAG: S8 family serine peptidase [bacterium]|nr:S8 family serine peptidase [bacterium]
MTCHTRMRSIYFMAGLLAVIFLLGACASSKPEAVHAPEKIVVLSLDELPVHTYSIEGTVSQLVDDRPALKKLHAEYLADLKADLAKYEINDTATLQGKYRSLATMELIAGNSREAVKLLNQVADMEDKEASRLTSGMVTKVLIQAKDSLPENYTQTEFQDSFVAHLSQYVNDLPYEVVQDNIKSSKGRAEYLSENLLRGVIQSQLDPAVAATGELSADQAGTVLGIRFTMDQMLALNPMVAKVYGDYLDKNMVEKENIWPAREFVFRDKMMRPEVLIGIWDSGVDSDVFRDIMFVNKNEKIDGTDTDGNGWVDDIHGIAFDLDGVYNTHLLHPLGDQEGKLDKVFGYMQGFTDLTSAIDSKAAGDVRKEMANMPPEKVGDFLTSLSFGGLYSHGTHVAGIACQDNPFARIMTARITFDYHNTPKAMTMETAQRMADGYRATTKYFSENQVRVVNMSWGWTFKEIEGSLEANGVGESAEERASMAREMIDVLSEGLYDSMADTPEILYISAAGNDDNDVEFDVVIPSSFELPNLVIVGAVDQAGDPTSFTSGGRNVRVYANGFQVESEVPGGGLMKMSGTSMASPNVCNLAGKILAVKPDLSPEAVVQLIEKNADPNQDHPNILLINPRKTIESIK